MATNYRIYKLYDRLTGRSLGTMRSSELPVVGNTILIPGRPKMTIVGANIPGIGPKVVFVTTTFIAEGSDSLLEYITKYSPYYDGWDGN